MYMPKKQNQWLRFLWSMAAVVLATLLMGAVAFAAEEGILAEDLSSSTKTAAESQVVPGGMVHYTIALRNTGTSPVLVNVTDTLPVELSLVSLSASAGTANSSGNTITGTWAINNGETITIAYTAELTTTAAVSSTLSNTVEIVGGSTNISRTATVTVVDGTADYSGSSKTANRTTARRGQTIQYTLVVSNAGTLADTVTLTDTLPADLTWSGSPASSGGGVFTPSGNMLIWTGPVGAQGAVTLTYAAVVSTSATVGEVLTNTAEIVGTGSSATVAHAVTVLTSATKVYLPFITTDLPILALSNTRPNSTNSWTLSWTGGSAGLSYEVQESQTADFAAVTTINPGTNSSEAVQRTASFNNVYYYRVRAVLGSLTGSWSNMVQVVGAYEDEFTSNTSNWKLRRTTNLNEVAAFYENSQNGFNESRLLIRVEDPRDWGLASPLALAPEPPYAIEYKMQTAQLNDRISAGAVFGGDWNGIPEPTGCINYSTLTTVYEHTDCFNKFYFANTINFTTMQLQFERVDQLVWCPSCGGSPMKRLGDVTAQVSLPGISAATYNVYRIEVRPNEIKFFVNGTLRQTYTDTRYITSPYFGIGASTAEFSNSTWRVDYYKVTPLDS